jgi:hypothetical protein
MEEVTPSTWEDPSLVQVWGPRFSAYLVAARDRAVFTLGRLPDDPAGRRRAEDSAARLRSLLGESELTYGEAGRALGVSPNSLRYAAPTGTVVMRWDGARQPTIRMVPPPDVDPLDARKELARRYLRVFGPATAGSFARWAGIPAPAGEASFTQIRRSLVPVATPIGDAWLLRRDEEDLRATPHPPADARLLPSGDAYYLLQGDDRALLVPDDRRRGLLWTSRVWPGALLVDGEVVGTWRRSQHEVTISAWHRLSHDAIDAVGREAASLPVPTDGREIVVEWSRC